MAAPSLEPWPCTPQATTFGSSSQAAPPSSSTGRGSRQRDSSQAMPRPPNSRWASIQVRGAEPSVSLQEVEHQRRRIEEPHVGQRAEGGHAGEEVGIPQGVVALGQGAVAGHGEGVGVGGVAAGEDLALEHRARDRAGPAPATAPPPPAASGPARRAGQTPPPGRHGARGARSFACHVGPRSLPARPACRRPKWLSLHDSHHITGGCGLSTADGPRPSAGGVGPARATRPGRPARPPARCRDGPATGASRRGRSGTPAGWGPSSGQVQGRQCLRSRRTWLRLRSQALRGLVPPPTEALTLCSTRARGTCRMRPPARRMRRE